jgi:hypothetical protein
MVAIAAEDYQAGNYWSAFFDHLGERRDQYVQSAYGDAFLAALDHFGLPFETEGQTYLGPLTLHAAVPTYCLGDLLQLLLQRERGTPGLDGEIFVAWATGIGAPTRLDSLDVPVRRFLRSGGEFAIDIADRLLEMLRAIQGGETDLRWTGLPERMVGEAVRLRDGGALDLTRRRMARSAGAGRGDHQPALRLDVATGSVVVRLPPVGEAPDGRAVWRVVIDGRAETVASSVLWPGSREPAPATQLAVRRPARSAVVSLAGSELSYEIDLVDADDPLLVFDDDGRLVTASAALPAGGAWLMHPDDVSLEVTGELSVDAEVAPPLGWEGWSLRRVSLDDVESLNTGRRRRWVRRSARARFELEEPVVGVTTRYGDPVYSSPPTVILPASKGAPVTWTVAVRGAGSGALITNTSHEVGTLDEVVDVFGNLPRPVLGSFDVTVRGPLGSGQERRVVIAEALRMRASRDFRSLTWTGLTPTKVHVSAARGVTAAPDVCEFGEHDLTRVIDVTTGASRETLHLTPPHMMVARVTESGAGRWSTRPLLETVESLNDPGRLVLRVPDESVAPSIRVRAGERTAQHLEPSGRRVRGQATYELMRVIDTVRAEGRADLVIDLEDMVIPVARFRPGRLATGCSVEDGQLVFADFAGVPDVSAGLYSYLAPWREPTVVSVERDGHAPLPHDCADAGPLAVLVRLQDPWVPEPWPTWPDERSILRVHQLGAPRLEPISGSAVVDYLVGSGPVPEDTESAPYLWLALHRRNTIRLGGVERDIRADAAAVFERHPAVALESLTMTGLNTDDVVELAVKTGMVLLAPSLGNPDVLRQLWQLYPAVACLAGAPTEILPLDAVEIRCGASALAVLNGDEDPFMQYGVFDAAAERFAAMTTQQFDRLWSAAQIVPQGLLDGDTRTAAARQLFDVRSHPGLRKLTEVARLLVADGEAALRSDGAPEATLAWLNARRGNPTSPSWVDLPAASAVLAGLARRAARGLEKSRELVGRAQRYWGPLATWAPALVTADIVLAELLERGASDPVLRTKGDGSDGEY